MLYFKVYSNNRTYNFFSRKENFLYNFFYLLESPTMLGPRCLYVFSARLNLSGFIYRKNTPWQAAKKCKPMKNHSKFSEKISLFFFISVFFLCDLNFFFFSFTQSSAFHFAVLKKFWKWGNWCWVFCQKPPDRNSSRLYLSQIFPPSTLSDLSSSCLLMSL